MFWEEYKEHEEQVLPKKNNKKKRNSTHIPSFIEMMHSAKNFYICSKVVGIYLGEHYNHGSLSLKRQTQMWGK